MSKEKLLIELEKAEKYSPDTKNGLNDDQIKARREAGLVNKTPKKVTKSYWKIFTDNFFSFFNAILFLIAILMLTGGIFEIKYYGFLFVLFANIIIGLVTDIRARAMVDKLRLITDPKARVVRNGEETEIPVGEIVYEDIMILSPGEQICADGIVVEGSLKTDESLISGESAAIEKTIGSQIYSGSYVKSGKAYVSVNRVGSANYAEDIQSKAQEFSRPKSELKRSCIEIFMATGFVSMLMGLLETATYIAKCINSTGFTRENYYDFTKMIGGSMVAMIPSGLYLLVSLTLATGVIALARKRMNVQELYCIEMLARVDVLCFDKTGTLTDGTIVVDKIHSLDPSYDETKIGEILGSLVKATKDENGTAKAISSSFVSAPFTPVASIPFDSEYKYSAASFEGEGTYIMGAYGFIEKEKDEKTESLIESLSSEGLRVIALYQNDKMIENGKIPCKNHLIALISFTDHIKDDAKPNIEWFKKNGVQVKVISGDNALTVSHIAGLVGVENASDYVSMDEVKDEDIPSLVENHSVFGRVKPEQKALIVEALQAKGHKVAMTGDGVNDIIALKKADCSIAMASGSSAARNVAHIVSMDNGFSKLPDVVGEGRRVINNLQRSASLFLGKTIFAIVVSFAFLVLSWCGKGGYPFSTTNLFVWEFATIGAGGFFLALQPSNERLSGSFVRNVLAAALPSGLMEILVVACCFAAHAINPEFMSYRAAVTTSTIAFTIMSYPILFRISLPLDKYRTPIFFFLFAVGVACFLLDFLMPGKTTDAGNFSFLLDLDYGVMNLSLAFFILGQIVLLTALYFFIDWLIRKNITHLSILKKKEGR